MTPLDKEAVPQGGFQRVFYSVKTSLVLFMIFICLLLVMELLRRHGEFFDHDARNDVGEALSRFIGGAAPFEVFARSLYILFLGVFLLHLIACLSHRLIVIRRRPSFRLFTRYDLLKRDHSFSITLSDEVADIDIENMFRRQGLKRTRYYSEDPHVKRLVSEKGMPFRWTSWLHHFCMVLVIVSLLLAQFISVEENFDLEVGQAEVLHPALATARERTLDRLLDRPIRKEPSVVRIELAEFTPHYAEEPGFVIPDAFLQRMTSMWSIGGGRISGELNRESIRTRGSTSLLKIYEDGRLALEGKTKTNEPFGYKGMTFYQAGFSQRFDLHIGEDVRAYVAVMEPFSIPEMEGEFRLRAPLTGTIETYFGEAADLLPSVMLEHRPPSTEGASAWNTVGKLILNRRAEIMHTEMMLVNVHTRSALKCRIDPSLPLLLSGVLLYLLFLALRTCFPWYQVWCHADDSSGRTFITVCVRMVGLFARPDHLKQTLQDSFTP